MGNKEGGEGTLSQNFSLEKLKDLLKHTYFTENEGIEHYERFISACDPKTVLTAESFLKAFPMFKNDKKIQKSVFKAIDESNDGSIGFEEYIKALSIMTRGSAEEKVNMALKIIDLDGNSKVNQKEIIEACSDIVKILKNEGYESELSVDEVVSRIFNMDKPEEDAKAHSGYVKFQSLTSNKNAVKELKEFEEKFGIKVTVTKEFTYKEFLERAVHDQDVLTCFGLFSLFYDKVVKPVEDKVIKCDTKFGSPYVAGTLTSKEWQYESRWGVVCDQFLTLYEDAAHAKRATERWALEPQGSLMARKWDNKEEFNLKLRSTLKAESALNTNITAIGLKNCTKKSLKFPQLFLKKGSEGKAKAPQEIKAGEYGYITVISGGLSGIEGLLSYEIDGTSKRFGVLFDSPYNYTEKVGNTIYCRVFNDTQKIDGDLYKTMNEFRLHESIEKSESGYQFKGVFGEKDDQGKPIYKKNRVTLRVEIHPAEHVPPPSLVVNLQEAFVRRVEGSNDTFYFKVYNYCREFKVEKPEHLDKWIYAIQMNSNPLKPNPYSSYSKVHKNVGCHYYVGGKDYFTDLAKCLKKAQTEILMTGWFITPTYYLSREGGKYWDALHDIFYERASKGVLIRVLVWDEIDAAFMLGSLHCKKTLMGLHKNIQVIRDPVNLTLSLWSHHQKTVIIDQDIAFCGGIDVGYNRYEDTSTYQLTDEDSLIYPGLCYTNPMVSLENLKHPHYDNYDRTKVPRMPWQDIQCKVVGGAARDIARNFIQRWNVSLTQGLDFIGLRDTPFNDDHKNEPYPNCKVQAIRSACKWSMGNEVTEKSIYKSQLDAITNSKHFIYIENQFFVSGYCSKQKNPENRFLECLVNRLRRAIKNKEDYRVILVTPNHSSSKLTELTVQMLTYWQLHSMTNGPYALYNILQKEFPDVDIENYIIICSLRNWGKFKKDNRYFTEMVYVHSKMMVVDDNKAWISSANINDRSFCGDRDSEIGVLIEDEDKIDVPFNGKKVKCGKYAHDLRMHCMRLHIGYKFDKSHDDEFVDPIKFYDTWKQIAYDNEFIYTSVFGKLENNIRKTDDLHYLSEYSSVLKARDPKKLSKLRGYVIPFPKDFLADSYTDPSHQSTKINKFYC